MGLYDDWVAKNGAANDKQIANVEFVLKAIDKVASFNADMVETEGRNLLTVLGVSTISAVGTIPSHIP